MRGLLPTCEVYFVVAPAIMGRSSHLEATRAVAQAIVDFLAAGLVNCIYHA